jgi:hypothetical protein
LGGQIPGETGDWIFFFGLGVSVGGGGDGGAVSVGVNVKVGVGVGVSVDVGTGVSVEVGAEVKVAVQVGDVVSVIVGVAVKVGGAKSRKNQSRDIDPLHESEDPSIGTKNHPMTTAMIMYKADTEIKSFDLLRADLCLGWDFLRRGWRLGVRGSGGEMRADRDSCFGSSLVAGADGVGITISAMRSTVLDSVR